MFRLLAVAALAAAVTTSAAADVLDDIAERGTIRLGVRAHAPPFSYRGAEGDPAGLAVRLCEEIARHIAIRLELPALEIEYAYVNARQRFPALTEGRTDLHCGPATATLERREILDFSILYFVDGAGAAARPGSFATAFDPGIRSIGVLTGTTTERVVRDLIARNEMDAEAVRFENHAAGLRALAGGELDIYFGDQAILLFQIASQGLAEKVSVMEEVFSFEPYALAMRRGESRLRLEVDRALSRIYERGQIYPMILDELGDFPLTSETRAVYQIVALP